jgi:hypothetical protein
VRTLNSYRRNRACYCPANPLEKLVVEAIRAKATDTEPKGDLSDRAVIDRYVTRIIVRPNSIDIELREPTPAPSLATEAPRNRQRGGVIHLHHGH